jgi:hypothetical protein
MPVIRFLAVGLGKVLSKVFGLATMSFFGRMPSRDDDRIAMIGIASLTWLTLVVAAFVPALAEAMVPFLDDEDLARRLTVATVIVLPPVIGAVAATMHNNRGSTIAGKLGYLASGYLYAAVIGVTVTALIVTVPLIKASYLVKRFTVVRTMVMIPEGAYDEALDHLREVLRSAGLECSVQAPSSFILTPFRWLGWVLGRVFDRDVADKMCVLRGRHDGDWFEIAVHAADISIIGNRRVAHLVHAALVDGLDERVLYLTWDDESQALERRIRHARERLDAGKPVERAELERMVEQLAALQLDREAWDAVRRLIYRLERDAERLGRAREEQTLGTEQKGGWPRPAQPDVDRRPSAHGS